MMIKQLRFALMAFSLIVVMKLLQVSFFYQPRKKEKATIQKVEVVKASADAKDSTQVSLEDSPEKAANNEQQSDKGFEESTLKNETSTELSEAFPTLDDLMKNYIAIKNAALAEGRSREDVVVRYYKHEKDGDKVYALKKLRYYLHEKPAAETKGLGSNVIYYGDQVNKEDIQVVAFVLLENGIPLKSIERSKYDWKSNSIEIGTDSLLIGKENLTKDKIRDL